jgi:hypothetical protein
MLDPSLSEEALFARLPALTPGEVEGLLDHPAAKERHILKVLLRADLPEAFLARLAKSRWASSVRVQFGLVNHPATPLGEALNFVKFLSWRDLNLTLQNFRLASEVRHRAESVLLQRLPAMALGEKMTLARTAAGQALKALRSEKDPGVVKALLENSRLVEEDVLFLINQPRTPRPVLETVARDPKWSCRVEVRVALLRNPSTPLSAVLPFITSLSATELRTLASDPKVPVAVRRMIQTRLGRGG